MAQFRRALNSFLLVLMLLTALDIASRTSFAQDNHVVYRVAFVTEDDVLNVRTGPGVDNDIIGTLPPDEAGITITGPAVQVGQSLWVPIHHSSLAGWVNRGFLTEQVVSREFCRDVRVFALIANLKTAVEERDGAVLSALIRPERGLRVRLNRWNTEVHLSADEVANLFTDSTVRGWGSGQGSGLPIEGTAVDVLLPLIERDLLPDRLLACDQVLGGPTTGLLILPPEYNAIHFYSIYRPASVAQNEFDWGAWAVGIEYWYDQPYLSYLVHYVWEI